MEKIQVVMNEDLMARQEEIFRLENMPQLNTKLVSRLFKFSPIGVYIIRKSAFKYVNPEFSKITGYSLEELQKLKPRDLIHPDHREEVRQKAIAMLKGERERPFIDMILSKSGEIRYILESVCPIIFEGKDAILGFFLDNTEEELIKEQLKKSEEKFQKAFHASPDWVVITTLEDGIYLEVNQAFLEATGYSEEEVIGKSSVDLGIWVDPHERDELHEILKQCGKICNAEVKFKIKSGKILDMLWSAHVIEYDGQRCLIAVSRDISDMKRAAEERMLREKLQGVLEMAGATCHEMNQPLQNIMFIVDELLAQYPEDPNCKELKAQVSRITDITHKLEHITTYSTKEYVRGVKIIDIDRASSYCRLD